MLKVGLIQSESINKNLNINNNLNLEKTIFKIQELAKAGAKIICTQELFCSNYFCQSHDSKNFELAEPIPGHTTEILCKLAKNLNVVIIASLFEKRLEGLYHNTAVIIDADGSLLGLYRKMHIPDDPDYYEKYYFAPGESGESGDKSDNKINNDKNGYKVWETKYAKIGVLICWDQWFPEAARITALKGADIIFYPTAIGGQISELNSSYNFENVIKQHEAWEILHRSHAIANGIFVCAVNRVGLENNINFWGQSFVCDPFGEILIKASDTKEENLICDIDLNLIRKTRNSWNFLRDRRVDSYKEILKLGK